MVSQHLAIACLLRAICRHSSTSPALGEGALADGAGLVGFGSEWRCKEDTEVATQPTLQHNIPTATVEICMLNPLSVRSCRDRLFNLERTKAQSI